MTPENVALHQAQLAQAAARPAPGSPEEMLAMVTQDSRRRQQVGLNPVGAGLSFLFGK